MTDLIDRLRGPCPSIPAMRDAADELTRLRESLKQEILAHRQTASLYVEYREKSRNRKAHIVELQANLKSVLDRETAMIGRYDAKLESAIRERDAALAEVERVKAFHLQARSAVKKWCADDQAADLGQMINDLLRITGAALTAGETDNGN